MSGDLVLYYLAGFFEKTDLFSGLGFAHKKKKNVKM